MSSRWSSPSSSAAACSAITTRVPRCANTSVSRDRDEIGGMPMTAVLEGVRILEVAEHTFVPAASALLADWGADVVKIEHVERGDAMRGLASTGVAVVPTDVHAL